MIAFLRKLHDRITAAGFAGAAACVAIITGSFWYEVVSRYFFSAPTTWAYDFASFALCPMIFLAVPEMTRRNAHVAVTYLTDGMPAHARARLTSTVLLVAALVCFIGAWITGAETWRQYVRGVETITAFPIQKWGISIFIPYGLLCSAFHFLRLFAGEVVAPLSEQEAR